LSWHHSKNAFTSIRTIVMSMCGLNIKQLKLVHSINLSTVKFLLSQSFKLLKKNLPRKTQEIHISLQTGTIISAYWRYLQKISELQLKLPRHHYKITVMYVAFNTIITWNPITCFIVHQNSSGSYVSFRWLLSKHEHYLQPAEQLVLVIHCST